MGRSLAGLVSEIEEGKTDGDGENGTEPEKTRGRSEYAPSRRISQDKNEDEENQGGEMPELSTNNKLGPPEKEKERGRTGSPPISGFQVARITVSDNEGEASPRPKEVQISTTSTDEKTEHTAR